MKWRSLEEQKTEQSPRSLREIYAERKELIVRYVPPDVQAVHARVVSELKHSGMAARALQSGSVAPEFELPDADGKLVRSADLLHRGPLVICFIRGRWCPFCVAQMEAMNLAYPEIQKLGASLVAISPQSVHQSFLMADQHRLRFAVLSDAGNEVAREFGLVYHVPPDEKEIYRSAFINLPLVNGDDSWELPIPATYIVGRQQANESTRPAQAILYGCITPDYTERPEPADIIHRLAQLLS